MGVEKLAIEIFGDTKDHRKKIQLWKHGTKMQNSNRTAILHRFPETCLLFNSPVYELLRPTMIDKEQVHRLLADYRNPNEVKFLEYWNLPKLSWQYLALEENPKPVFPVTGQFNTKGLAECGAVDGFIIILGLLHQINFEIAKDNEGWTQRTVRLGPNIIEAARAFPVFARHPDIRPFWESLYVVFKKLWYFFSPSLDSLVLDDDLIAHYVTMDADYCLTRGACGRIPGSHRLKAFKAPVFQASAWEHASS